MLRENTSALDNKTTASHAWGECLKQYMGPVKEVSASSFSTSKIPNVSDRGSPSSVTEVFVTFSEMIVFSSKWIEITVPNHPYRTLPTRASKLL